MMQVYDTMEAFAQYLADQGLNVVKGKPDTGRPTIEYPIITVEFEQFGEMQRPTQPKTLGSANARKDELRLTVSLISQTEPNLWMDIASFAAVQRDVSVLHVEDEVYRLSWSDIVRVSDMEGIMEYMAASQVVIGG